MNVKTPQAGIFRENAQHMHFLEYRLTSSNLKEIKQALAKAIDNIKPDDISLVVSFGKEAWQLLQPNWTPTTLDNFVTINGQQGHTAPSTQADLFFWIQGIDMGVVFDLADRISVLVYGKIIATDTPENIRNNKIVQEAYLGSEEEV